MENTSFMRVEEVAQELGVSKSYAYEAMKKRVQRSPKQHIRASASKRSDARCRISLGTNRSNASSPRSARNSPSGLRATRAR